MLWSNGFSSFNNYKCLYVCKCSITFGYKILHILCVISHLKLISSFCLWLYLRRNCEIYFLGRIVCMGTIAKLLVHINTLNNHPDKTILNIYIGWFGSESYWLFLYKTRIYPVSSTAVTQTMCFPTSSVLGVQVTSTWNVIMPLGELTFNFETLNGSNSRPRTMNVFIDL